MSGVHENLKYGDLIYIEFFDNSSNKINKDKLKDKSKKSKYSITAEGFSLKPHSDLNIKEVLPKQSLKNYENKLFIILPPMNDKFLTYKIDLEEKLNIMMGKLDSENHIEINKEDINKMIFNYNETKKEVNSHCSTILNEIGNNIKFSNRFVLIHFKSQMFVSVIEEISGSNKGHQKLSLSEYYSENCIFSFWPVNKSDNINDDAFSNQDIYIRKCEKNIWANNPFLRISEDKKEIVEQSEIKEQSEANIRKNYLTICDTQNDAQKFEIRICSCYIDPSSLNLSFSNNIWLISPSQDKFLLVNNEEDKIKKAENNEIDQKDNERDGEEDENIFDHTIEFKGIENEKSINNIYGLFSVEQIEEIENNPRNIMYSEENSDPKMSPYIEYNKIVRLKHTATKKYLGFQAATDTEIELYKNHFNQELPLTKELGRLFLTKNPKEETNWVIMESYIILNRENYEKSKLEGMKFSKNRVIQRKENLVKKKDIIRIFHYQSNKFLSLSNIIINDPHSRIGEPKFDKKGEHSKFNKPKVLASLNKLPVDNDLFKLLPSNESTIWEINLILYFSKEFDELITSCGKTKETLKGRNIKNNSLNNNQNEINIIEEIPNKYNHRMSSLMNIQDDPRIPIDLSSKELENIKKKWYKLRICFKDLRDFCLNKYSKRFDPTVPTGRPVFYRQEFLYEQKFIEKTLEFLKRSKWVLEDIRGFKKDKNKTNRVQLYLSDSSQVLSGVYEEINKCITWSFEFLSAVCKNNSINKELVFNERDIFFKNNYLLIFKEASECLIDIIKDDENYMMKIIQENIGNQLSKNKNIPENPNNNNLIETIIKYLNSCNHYDSYTLSLLPKLMKSKNKGITSNQELIFELLLEQKRDKFLLRIEPKYEFPGFDIIYKNESGDFEKKDMIELCKIRTSITNYDRNIVRYLSEQLNIYADMCFGRNYVCIKAMKNNFPLDHLLYHICRIELYEEILVGLINILNYVYIDIQPHFRYYYSNMVKIIDEKGGNLVVKKPKTEEKILTNIPLDKLNIILCNALYILYFLKYGKSLVNTSNIKLIYNIISFRLYDYVEFNSSEDKEKELYYFPINNLKMEIKKIISSNDPAKEQDGEVNLIGFYETIGYKFIEFSHERELGSEYLFFIIEYINNYFLNNFILQNIDSDFKNRNIIIENFNSIGKQDVLTQNNVNFLMKSVSDIKKLISHKNSNASIDIAPIIKPIYKTIDLIFSIKIDEQSNKIIENIIKVNKDIVLSMKDRFLEGKLFDVCYGCFLEKKNFKEIFLDNSHSLHKLSHKSREFNYFNIAAFHKLNELIIRILEINADEYLIKIMVKLFSKVNSQRLHIINNLKKIKLLFNKKEIDDFQDIQQKVNLLMEHTETTELWLKDDINEDDEEYQTYESVLSTLEDMSKMFYKNSVMKSFKGGEKINFLQTTCFSLNLDEILFSLLREIIQLYGEMDSEGENNNTSRHKDQSLNNESNKGFVFVERLNILIKNIFKLIKCIIYNSEHFQKNIQTSFLDFKSHEFLYNLGYLNLLIEIISLSSNFTQENSDFIMEVLQKEFTNLNFFGNTKFLKLKKKVSSRQRAMIDFSSKEKEVKRIIRVLKLMNLFVSQSKEEKYINILIKQYEEILKNVTENDFFGFKEDYQIEKSENKLFCRKMTVLCELIKIGCNLILINQKLKGIIKNLFSIEILDEKIIKKETNIFLEKHESSPLSKRKENHLYNNEDQNKNNLIRKCLSLINTMKLKYYSWTLFFTVSNFDFKNFKNVETSKSYLDVFVQDLDNFQKNRKFLIELKDKKLRTILNKYINASYKYFILGAARMINFILILITETGEMDRLKSVIFHTFSELRKILIEDDSFKSFQKVLSRKVIRFLNENKTIFKLNDNISLEESDAQYKIEKVHREFKKESHTTGFNLLEYKKKEKDIFKYMSVALTEDILTNIEEIEYTRKFVHNESKILAKKIKNRVNFHNILDFYFNNGNSIEAYTEYDFHLFNIFLKFIQENYQEQKYYPQINFIVQLFADFIVAKAKILKIPKNVYINSFFSNCVKELNNVCLLYCQKLFLNNGTVEIFVKIITENNNSFNQFIFPTILKVFNNILMNGNNQSQVKFLDLFNYLNQSDNFFKYLKQLFSNDIYFFLKNDSKLKARHKDMIYTELIIQLLKFLELLTENHNLELQNYLREQPNNKVSYNFIKIIMNYMEELINRLNTFLREENCLGKEITRIYYLRIIACLETLCEFLQGPCLKNQESIINSKIIELFDKILRETDFPTVYDLSIKSNDEIEESKLNNQIEIPQEDYDLSNSNHNNSANQSLNQVNNSSYTNNNKKIFSNLTNYEKSMLIYKTGLVLLAILEGRKTVDEVIKKILRDFNYKLFYNKMTEICFLIKSREITFFLFQQDHIMKKGNYDNLIVVEAGFNLYFFLSHLYTIENDDTEFCRYYSEISKELKLYSEIIGSDYFHSNPQITAMKFFRENSLNVEIVRDGSLHKVFFPKLNYFNQFTTEIMESFRRTANHSSIQTKLTAILNENENLRQTLKLIYKVENEFKKLGLIKYLLLYPKVFQTCSIVLSIIVNIFILTSYSAIDLDGNNKPVNKMTNLRLFWKVNEKVTNDIFIIIACFMILFSALVFTDFITRKAPLLFRTIIGKYYKNLYETKTKSINSLEIKRIYQILKQHYFQEIIKKIGISLQLLLNLEIIYYLGYFIFAILALKIHNFFFAYHLIEFIRSQEVLRNVLKAIYNPKTQLLFIFIFFMILQYFYALILYYWFYNDMPDNSCESVFICMISIYTATFTSSGNLGNFIDSKSANTPGNIKRYILDLSFNFIMVWLVFQMITGLIVDTFSSLRKIQEEYDKDFKNVCFICGLEREEIEKLYLGKEGFNNHLEDHKVSSYFGFMFYLKEIRTGDTTGIESYVKELMEKDSINWFPQEKCLKMEMGNMSK